MYSIYNVSAIAGLIKENKEEKNLYQKVSAMLKGSNVGSPALRSEVAKIIQEQYSNSFELLGLTKPLSIAS